MHIRYNVTRIRKKSPLTLQCTRTRSKYGIFIRKNEQFSTGFMEIFSSKKKKHNELRTHETCNLQEEKAGAKLASVVNVVFFFF